MTKMIKLFALIVFKWRQRAQSFIPIFFYLLEAING